MPVLSGIVDFLIHPATVVILLILGISFIIIITILICVKVCVIGMAGSDDEDDWLVHLFCIFYLTMR